MPRIGYRNIKTSLAVLSCIVIYTFLGRQDYFYACIAAILCMGNTIENSVESGKHRVIGTLIGGFFSILMIFLIKRYININYYNPLMLSLSVSVVIYLCNVFNSQEASGLSCIVFLSVMINYANQDAILYVAMRTLDTIVGISIAFIINVLIKPQSNADLAQS